MGMYGIYNSDTLEQLNDIMLKMHNKTIWNEKKFASKLYHWYHWHLSKDGVDHYAINSLLFLTMTREKYVKMYERFVVLKTIQITNPDHNIVIKRLHLY